MALADYDAYLNALNKNRASEFNTSTGGRTLRLAAGWRSLLPAPSTPTTSVALDKTSDACIGDIPAISTGRLTALAARMSAAGNPGFTCILVDLLNQSGGLNGTLTSVQTTGLPTAALTRYTSGEGVMAGAVIYTTVGTAGTAIRINYTNQSGTSGQISTTTQIGATNFNAAGTLIPIPLAAGDTGVRSVESVTLDASTGTAGNFGICLFKPLQMMALSDDMGAMPLDAVSSGGIIGSLCEVNPDACLTVMTMTNISQTVLGALILAEV